ncbi:MAG TPA: DUF1501 domain-containing protein [Verrucomicrobiales bacterium]|nr:DUF1501 domain-containing protein [Verrucomicrobiales bacterium]
MLTIYSDQPGSAFCDGFSRRNFLRIGALGLGGMTLPNLLRAEAASGRGIGHKAVIMIFLPGGPPHQDMFDLKTDAPSEIRGEFRPISTNVPGIQVCELFPRLAGMMDKLAIIRSVVGAIDDHNAYQCMTGRIARNVPPGGWPSIGSVLSYVQGATGESLPPFVGLAPKMGEMRWADPGRPGFLGPSHAPFQPNGRGAEDMVLQGVSLERLADRRNLLASFDRFRRETDASGAMEGIDIFTEQAFGVLTSSRLAEALDIEKEDPGIRERYGKGKPENVADGGPRLVEQFLMARRLVEAGVRCVTLAFSRWDWHGGNFRRGREDMPMLDQGVSALVQDLHERGLDRDVSLIVWGEFGRTPTINKDAGRDHWPRVSCALLAGGGMRTGQVIGSTDRLGGEASDRPVHFQEIHATLYHNAGIDIKSATVPDLTGRPRFLVDQEYEAIRELTG